MQPPASSAANSLASGGPASSPPWVPHTPVISDKQRFNQSPRSRILETKDKPKQLRGVVRVIPVSGGMQLPEIPLKVGTATWDLLFSNLMNWLPELEGIEDENSVMLQYKENHKWKPLAGNDQLRTLLYEFSSRGWSLYVRCAPMDEFESGSDQDPDDILMDNKLEPREPMGAKCKDIENVGLARLPSPTVSLSCS